MTDNSDEQPDPAPELAREINDVRVQILAQIKASEAGMGALRQLMARVDDIDMHAKARIDELEHDKRRLKLELEGERRTSSALKARLRMFETGA